MDIFYLVELLFSESLRFPLEIRYFGSIKRNCIKAQPFVDLEFYTESK